MSSGPVYTIHERIWHWLQGLTIIILLVSGAEVHAPASVRIFGFSTAVIIHNTFAVLLLLNALLGLFYFLTSQMLKQYIPEPQDFFSMATRQAMYYLRGIFRNEKHPMEHGGNTKLNPLQKVTYLAILNVLLPVQVASGLLIWAAQWWPGVTARIGGLPVIIPIHTITAWFFLAFTIMHIYLTTTGETPLANIRAMITGHSERSRAPRTEED